ncbi:hypothetical protein PCL1606_13900 [Pseudomonas chlororaphis]|uniref:Uncharacterized protein n=1 Tax=Pseudomonas chlororaphis TaxID=587753 RepID=A0A0D5XVY3_9PSED|nr:hypothetical protein PCL1606_13900 [Pseudomonas chlororaphis]
MVESLGHGQSLFYSGDQRQAAGTKLCCRTGIGARDVRLVNRPASSQPMAQLEGSRGGSS